MSSQPPLPSPTDDYAPPPGTIWNAATYLATIVHMAGRVRSLEAVRVTLDDIINDLQVFGLQRLDQAIVPLIEEQQAALANLQQQITAALAATQQLVDQFQDDTAAALAGLQTQIDAALAVIEGNIGALQAQVDEILAGGISADNVSETANRLFLSAAERAAIADIADTLSDFSAAVNATLASYEKKWEPWSITTSANATLTDRAQDQVNTAGGAATRLLPATPSANMAIRVQRIGSNLLTVDANGSVFKTRAGNATTIEMTVEGITLEFRRNAANDAWVVS